MESKKISELEQYNGSADGFMIPGVADGETQKANLGTLVEQKAEAAGFLKPDGLKTINGESVAGSGDIELGITNPFKGEFPSLEALNGAYPEPVVGEYAVVDVSGTDYVFRCSTAGEWPTTSSEEYDPASDPVFGSGEQLLQTGIDGTGLKNAAGNALAKAGAVMKLASKLESVNMDEVKISLVENTNWYDDMYVDASTSQGRFVQQNSLTENNGILVVNVTGKTSVRFLGVHVNNSTVVGYGFSSSENAPTNTPNIYQLDLGVRVFKQDGEGAAISTYTKEEYVVRVPRGAKWFACTIAKNSTYDIMDIEDFYCYLQSGYPVAGTATEGSDVADFEIADEAGHVIMMIQAGHIRTKEFDSKETLTTDEHVTDYAASDNEGNVLGEYYQGHFRTKRFDSRDMVSKMQNVATMKWSAPIPYIPVDNTQPVNKGQKNCIALADFMTSILWTPIRPMPATNSTPPVGFVSDGNEDSNVVAGRRYWTPGVEVEGLPYSNCFPYGRAIGSDIRFETFMTALRNPNSVVYTRDARDYSTSSIASCYYGHNCSSYNNLLMNIPVQCIGRPYSFSTNRWIEYPKQIECLQIGDGISLYKSVPDQGHVILIKGIEKSNGEITHITVTESYMPKDRTVRYTVTDFINRYFKGGAGYEFASIYRNTGLVNLTEFEEFNPETYQYSDKIGLNLGNNTNYDKSDDIPIEVSFFNDSIDYFDLYYGGVLQHRYYRSDGVAGYDNGVLETKIITLDKSTMATGVYEVRPESGVSQYFCLAKSGNVTANRLKNGDIYVVSTNHSDNVSPFGVLLYSNKSYETTRGMWDMGGNAITVIPKEWFDYVDVFADATYVMVAYRNEYGNIFTQKIAIN